MIRDLYNSGKALVTRAVLWSTLTATLFGCSVTSAGYVPPKPTTDATKPTPTASAAPTYTLAKPTNTLEAILASPTAMPTATTNSIGIDPAKVTGFITAAKDPYMGNVACIRVNGNAKLVGAKYTLSTYQFNKREEGVKPTELAPGAKEGDICFDIGECRYESGLVTGFLSITTPDGKTIRSDKIKLGEFKPRAYMGRPYENEFAALITNPPEHHDPIEPGYDIVPYPLKGIGSISYYPDDWQVIKDESIFPGKNILSLVYGIFYGTEVMTNGTHGIFVIGDDGCIYKHLHSEQTIPEGTRVKPGDKIGKVGSKKKDGYHTHLEVYGNDFGHTTLGGSVQVTKRVDPFRPWLGKRLQATGPQSDYPTGLFLPSEFSPDELKYWQSFFKYWLTQDPN